VVFEGLAFAVFFAADLDVLPHGFLEAHPPFWANILTPFHSSI
jgi:hypothetical protein